MSLNTSEENTSIRILGHNSSGGDTDEDYETWSVSYKFYKLTGARIWSQSNVMSGFEVTFSPDSSL